MLHKRFLKIIYVFLLSNGATRSQYECGSSQQCGSILQEVMKDGQIPDEISEQAKEHFELINHSKIYDEWLQRFTNRLESGNIFSFLPR